MNLATFTIDHLIVHDVPRHRVGADDNEEILLSDIPSTLNVGLRNFFTERIKRSLSSNHYEVERDPASSSPVPDLIASLIASEASQVDDELVTTSQEMARHLFSTQTGSNNPGLLIVCRGKVDGRTAAAILKLEREDAIRVSQVGQQGHRTFDVEYLRDLMLGKNTRVFKASIFTVPASGLDGLVSDAQKNDPNADVASFFLHRFLGCRLKTAPDIATRAFFTATQDFINTLEDAEKQARYEIALLAAMNTPTRTMMPGMVANQMDTHDRQAYRNYLGAHAAPTGRFDKDTRLISAQLRQMVFGFKSSGLRLSGPAEDVQQFVRFNEGTGEAPVEIHDEVKDVRGGTR